MVVDWAVVVATCGAFVLIATPLGRFFGVWVGSDDPTANFWQRFYGSPGLALYVISFVLSSVCVASSLARGWPWMALFFVLFALLQVVGGVTWVRQRRQKPSQRRRLTRR